MSSLELDCECVITAANITANFKNEKTFLIDINNNNINNNEWIIHL